MVHCYSAVKLLYVLYSHIVCSICCTDSHEVVEKVITDITLLLAADTEHWRHIEGQIQNLFSIRTHWENSECELIILFSIHLVHADLVACVWLKIIVFHGFSVAAPFFQLLGKRFRILYLHHRRHYILIWHKPNKLLWKHDPKYTKLKLRMRRERQGKKGYARQCCVLFPLSIF